MTKSGGGSKNQSKYEDAVEKWLKKKKLDYKSHIRTCFPGRKLEADFLVDDHIIIEVNGGMFKNYGHGGGAGLARDYEKYSLATWLGYKLIIIGTTDFNPVYEKVTNEKTGRLKNKLVGATLKDNTLLQTFFRDYYKKTNSNQELNTIHQ